MQSVKTSTDKVTFINVNTSGIPRKKGKRKSSGEELEEKKKKKTKERK